MAKVNKEIYLYLDINGKLDHNFFQKQDIFFKIVNFHKKHPLVQIGNYVFQGTYEDYLGTKVFLVENEDKQPDENVFVKQSPLHLEYLCKTSKTLRLKWAKIPSDVVHVEQSELLDLQFNESYSDVLKKLEKSQLNIDDIVANTNSNNTAPQNVVDTTSTNDNKVVSAMEVEETQETSELENEVVESHSKIETVSANQASVDKYSLLKELAGKPVRQREDFQKVFEVDPKVLKNVDSAENFAVLKQLFLQSLSSDYFPIEVNKNEFAQYVNIEKSVQDGIVSDSDVRHLNVKHKQELLSAKNFNNFSVPMKLTYLTMQLKEHKRLLESMSPDDLNVIDKYGRTAKDRYRMLKRLTKDMWYYVYSQYRNN